MPPSPRGSGAAWVWMKIGLFGGTFNPVHRGHLLLAEGAMKQLGLDEVRWIPAHLPPHKSVEGKAGPEDRARMVELAIQGQPAFRLSRVELDRPAPSYTIDTVRLLQERDPGPGTEWFFLIGSDTARELPAWREIEELMKRVRFVAVPRPGKERAAGLPAGVQEIPVQTVPVSSSDVRRLIREGRPAGESVPEPVLRYIQEKGLYR